MRMVSLLLTLMMVVSMVPMMGVTSNAATFESVCGDRDDGIWLFPLGEEYYLNKISDWAGCTSDNCFFHGVIHENWKDINHSGKFGHNGIDIGCNVGTAVMSASNGKLYYQNKNWGSRGKTAVVETKLGNGWSYYAYYQHLSDFGKYADGDDVAAGDVIAYSGNTDGTSSGGAKHLHFGIVMGPSGLGASVANIGNKKLNELEGKEWLIGSGYREGRILNNPAQNNDCGYPVKTVYITCIDALKQHCGSVHYTFDKSKVTLGDSYLSKCVYHPSYGTVKTTANTSMWTLPCSDETDPKSTIIGTRYGITSGTTLKVTGLYENYLPNNPSTRHFWYRIEKDGKTGYVWADHCASFTSLTEKDDVLTGQTKPTNIVVGKAFDINGTIKLNYNELKSVSAYVYDSNGTAKTGTTVNASGKSYSLMRSTVDTSTKFNNLSVGTYTFKIFVSETGYYANSSNQIATYSRDNVELYSAVFNVVNAGTTTYTVSYNANGGSGAPAAQTKTKGTALTLSSTKPTRTGYDFLGWSTSSAATSATYSAGASYTTDASVTLYAVWKIKTYTITWDINGATTTETYTYGATPSYKGGTPTKASTAQYSYTFSGWSPSITTVTGNKTYTAQFTSTVRNYTVTWNVNGTTTTETYAYGAMPSYKDGTPTKASTAQYSYTFSGWSPTISTVTGNQTYTAQFTQVLRKYTISWIIDGVRTTQSYNYGATPSHETPTKAADDQYTYTFSGWSPSITTVTGAKTYVAMFDAVAKQTIGDVNGDGCFSIGDVTVLLLLLSDGVVSVDANPAADLNGDGVFGIGDVSCELTLLAGID